MSAPSIQPLRIQKGTDSSSPSKMAAIATRPLAEVSPMAIRRNSPSFPQGNKGSIFRGESSPFESSPHNMNPASSPRLFWQGRDPTSPARGSLENRSPFTNQSPSPAKRSSIENLKKAFRVKNSGIFAIEQNNKYDPAQPAILNGRPLSTSVQGNAFGGKGFEGLRNEFVNSPPMETTTTAVEPAPFHQATTIPPLSSSKNNISPTKSSLSKRTGLNAMRMGFDPETGIWEDEDEVEKKLPQGRGLHRRGKSVTFDQAPPQINEYEMTTPDPSSVASGSREGSYESMEDEEVSFERGSSLDREDSFDASLEDTDKTPVVLPEDWRFMSPDNANTALSHHEEDVFEDDYGSPAPTAQPGATTYRPQQSSVNSVDSNGQPRPLPPLPSLAPPSVPSSGSRDSLSGTLERISNTQRSLPSPPQAAMISKSDIRRMSGGAFSLEDRLRLMMVKDGEQTKSDAEKQRERKLRRAGSKDTSPVRGPASRSPMKLDDSSAPSPAVFDSSSVPRISRDSILRSLRSEASQQELNGNATPDENASFASSPPRLMPMDPDVAIPSLEDPTQELNQKKPVFVKEEEADENELYSIPDLYSHQANSDLDREDDGQSQYSQLSIPSHVAAGGDEGADTPRALSPAREPEKRSIPSERMSLPDFMDFGERSSFLDLSTYMTPPAEKNAENALPQPPVEFLNTRESAGLRTSLRPTTPELPKPFLPYGESNQEEPGTPDSVIRHAIKPSPAPEVAPDVATVKAPGSKLKIRPSFTPAEAATTIELTRKNASGEITPPPIPGCDESRPSLALAEAQDSYTTAPSVQNETFENSQIPAKPKQRNSSLVQLDIPHDQSEEGLGFGLEKEFDRVVEAQKVAFELSLQRLYYPFHGRFPSSEFPDPKDSKYTQMANTTSPIPKPRGARALPGDEPARGHIYPTDGNHFANRSPGRQRGYLMRQNTKVVVASERSTYEEKRAQTNVPAEAGLVRPSSADSAQFPSNRKISQPTWTAEPWNGKSRRRSIRTAGDKSPSKKKPVEGPAPPLPGQASNVQDTLGAVAEDEIAEEEAEDFEDGAERGRLFVKVIGVKDLDLPLPKYERTSFALTLDNGLHCVTTAWLDLDKSAPIGQEFELVVLNELEFQLTLQMKLEEPKIERPSSPSKAPSSPTKKQGAFGRFFGSPKKRKESELRVQQAQQEAYEAANRPVTPPTAYEIVQGLVAKDGSFARAYVSLAEHEKQSFGRPYSVDIVCFNEWAMEQVDVGSSRSKKSVTQLQRRPPYPIGKLELQLLYIPKPKNAKDEDMPKSMNSAVRELKEAETRFLQAPKEFEGHLSQQGGDCPYWRRRFFKLVGSKLTAYHESTLQPRATINLAKASKLIDDKSALMQKEISTKGGGRRKSAFAEEEDGYMFVEEGFRIRFANGEVIDFYADTAATKDDWMKVLSQVVGKAAANAAAPVKGWTEMVLKREKSMRKHKAAASPQKKNKELPRPEPTPAKAAPVAKENVRPAHRGSGLQLPPSSIPTPNAKNPVRPVHTRTESHPPQSGPRSEANSPMKNRISKEERQKKSRSMIDQWR